jgi:hypothetical protein
VRAGLPLRGGLEARMSATSNTTEQARSVRDRAVSRGVDLIAAYLSDLRGWGSYTTPAQLLADSEDAQSAAGDLIADVMHALEQLGFNGPSAAAMAEQHFYEERDDHVAAAGTPFQYIPDTKENA